MNDEAFEGSGCAQMGGCKVRWFTFCIIVQCYVK